MRTFALALRNLLRNRRRSLTTLLAMERNQSGADEEKLSKLKATLDQARKDKSDLETAATSDSGTC